MLVNLILLLLLFGLQYALWMGDKNVFDLRRLQNTVEAVQIENEQLSRRNDKLLAEVIDLKEGGEMVETLARSELGLIKEGETFYQIVD